MSRNRDPPCLSSMEEDSELPHVEVIFDLLSFREMSEVPHPVNDIVVYNIPATYSSVDLRSFFSSVVEQGGFARFHYQHRRDASKGGNTRCCRVQLSGAMDPTNFWKNYHERKWTGLSTDVCLLRPHEASDTYAASGSQPGTPRLTDAEFRALVLEQKARELNPPPGLPYGNVGTPSRILRANQHVLPPKFLRKLGMGLSSTLSQNLREKHFGFDYSSAQSTEKKSDVGKTFARGNVNKRPAKRYMKDVYDWTDGLDMTQKVHDPLDNDDALKAAAERSDSESEEEDWDRHARLQPVMDNGRLLDKVGDEYMFEHDVDNPWDKGDASGLVHYTDALYWDANKGGFDERTVDAWDVDTSGDKHKISGAVNRRQLRPLRDKRGYVDKGAKVASTIMARQGWRAGQGLGKRCQGIRDPVTPSNNMAGIGLGFPMQQHGGKQRQKLLKKRKAAAAAADRELSSRPENDGDGGFNWASEPRFSDFIPPESIPIGSVFDKPTGDEPQITTPDERIGSFRADVTD